MLHRVKKENDMHEGKWNGLGGKFEKDETPEECVIREVMEESGLLMEEPKFKGMIVFPNFAKGQTWQVFIYTCDKFSGELIESNEGNLEWIDNDKLLDLNLWEGDKVFLKWLNQDKIFSAKFIYENGIFKDYTVNFY